MEKDIKNSQTTATLSRRAVRIIVKDKNGTLIDEEARAISSFNEVGIFDVLPLHTQFISLIRQKITIHGGRDGRNREINIGSGLMKVAENQVSIYLGLPEPTTPTPNKSNK